MKEKGRKQFCISGRSISQRCLLLLVRQSPPLLQQLLRQRQTVHRQPLAKNLPWLQKRNTSACIVVVVSVDRNIDPGTKDRVSYIYISNSLSQIQGGVLKERDTLNVQDMYSTVWVPATANHVHFKFCYLSLLTRHRCRYQRTSFQVSKMPKHFCSSRSFVTTRSYCARKGWWRSAFQ